MKTDKTGLLFRETGALAFEVDPESSIDLESARDLGGTVEFSPEEAAVFMHIVGMQSAKAALKSRRKRRKLELEEDIDD